jgi:hypothetical protein
LHACVQKTVSDDSGKERSRRSPRHQGAAIFVANESGPEFYPESHSTARPTEVNEAFLDECVEIKQRVWKDRTV